MLQEFLWFNHLLDEWIVKFDANNVVNKDRSDDNTVQLPPKSQETKRAKKK